VFSRMSSISFVWVFSASSSVSIDFDMRLGAFLSDRRFQPIYQRPNVVNHELSPRELSNSFMKSCTS
jgi:hypothetical protein